MYVPDVMGINLPQHILRICDVESVGFIKFEILDTPEIQYEVLVVVANSSTIFEGQDEHLFVHRSHQEVGN